MYTFWYDYAKQKYGEIAKLCYTDVDTFVIHIITDDFFKDIAPDVDIPFDTSNYNGNDKIPLPIGKSKNVPGVFKDKLGGKIIVVVALRSKTWAYLMNDCIVHKKAKGTKKCVIKRRLMFENYKDCLFNEKNIFKNNKDLKVIIMICTQKKLIRLH